MKLQIKDGVLIDCIPEEKEIPEREITLPEEVTRVRRKAFDRADSVRIVKGCSVEETEGYCYHQPVFSGKACVFPKMPRSEAIEMEDKVSLALGFCLDPDLYKKKDGYKGFLRTHREMVEKAAASLGISEEIRDNLTKLAPQKEEEDVWKDPVRLAEQVSKKSERAKVFFVEEAVLKYSASDLDKALSALGCIEFDARALALAGRYRGREVLKVLLKHGFSFHYSYWDPALQTKYHYRDGTFYAAYETMMIPEDLRDSVLELRFPGLPEAYKDRAPLPLREREENVRYLISRSEASRISSEQMLYYAVLWGEQEFASFLRGSGVRVLDRGDSRRNRTGFMGLSVILGKKTGNVQEEYFWCLKRLPAEKLSRALCSLAEIAEDSGEKPILYERMLEFPGFQDVDVKRILAERFDFSRVSRRKFLELCVDADNDREIRYFCESGFLRRAADLDYLIEKARGSKMRCLSVLLDYREKIRDPQAEERREKRKMYLLSASVDSVAVQSRIWSYKNKEDGSLLLTSYKGEDPDVTVPSRIGKRAVTELAEKLFSPCRSRITGKRAGFLRDTLHSVLLPDSIQKIPKELFYTCEALTEVRLPDSLREIQNSAFDRCHQLKDLTVPPSVTEIHPDAFGYRYTWYRLCENHRIRIHGKAGSYVEKWCMEQEWPFVAERDETGRGEAPETDAGEDGEGTA